MRGQIIKVLSDYFTVYSNGLIINCRARGNLKRGEKKIVVGDFVLFDKDESIIYEVLPRRNNLIRPPVSNIDQAVILISVKEPDFSSNLLDKLLLIIEFNEITPVICFTKLDLCKNNKELEEANKLIDYYKRIGYDVFTNDEFDLLKNIFKDKSTIFTGQSGVGKSTLLNRLDNSFELKTAPISKALGRGKHTTRHTELYTLYDGLVADTPGFSSLDISKMSSKDVSDNFIEIKEASNSCKYRDCKHINEPNCFVIKSVSEGDILDSRYENYKKFIEEIKKSR